MDAVFSSLYAFFSNGLVIALLAAIFTSFLNNIHRSFNRFVDDLKAKMFFAKECIFLIEQNKIWFDAIAKNNVPLEIGLKHIAHIGLMNSTYTSILDGFIFDALLNYEKIVTFTIANFVAKAPTKIKNEIQKKCIESSEMTIKIMTIALDVYKGALENPQKQFINNLMGVPEIQPDNILITQEMSEKSQHTTTPKQTL